jgi:hypothetical protein
MLPASMQAQTGVKTRAKVKVDSIPSATPYTERYIAVWPQADAPTRFAMPLQEQARLRAFLLRQAVERLPAAAVIVDPGCVQVDRLADMNVGNQADQRRTDISALVLHCRMPAEIAVGVRQGAPARAEIKRGRAFGIDGPAG